MPGAAGRSDQPVRRWERDLGHGRPPPLDREAEHPDRHDRHRRPDARLRERGRHHRQHDGAQRGRAVEPDRRGARVPSWPDRACRSAECRHAARCSPSASASTTPASDPTAGRSAAYIDGSAVSTSADDRRRRSTRGRAHPTAAARSRHRPARPAARATARRSAAQRARAGTAAPRPRSAAGGPRGRPASAAAHASAPVRIERRVSSARRVIARSRSSPGRQRDDRQAEAADVGDVGLEDHRGQPERRRVELVGLVEDPGGVDREHADRPAVGAHRRERSQRRVVRQRRHADHQRGWRDVVAVDRVAGGNGGGSKRSRRATCRAPGTWRAPRPRAAASRPRRTAGSAARRGPARRGGCGRAPTPPARPAAAAPTRCRSGASRRTVASSTITTSPPRSGRRRLMCGVPRRAVTFQLTSRTRSPGW